MTRRDIIIVAALVNAGLLALLFMLATHSDDDKITDPTELGRVIEISPVELSEPTVVALSPSTQPTDEVDNALKEYSANPTPQQVIIEDDILGDQDDGDVQAMATLQADAQPVVITPEAPGKVVEVTVKRGDSLDRIARANKSSVQAIRDANNLKNDRLNIGQVLKVPVSVDAKIASSTTPAKPSATKPASKPAESKPVAQGDAQYYTVKSGDNPWKIAKQFKIKLDDLLKLNNMDEDKARNMKVGDRIRVK